MLARSTREGFANTHQMQYALKNSLSRGARHRQRLGEAGSGIDYWRIQELSRISFVGCGSHQGNELFESYRRGGSLGEDATRGRSGKPGNAARRQQQCGGQIWMVAH